MNAYDSRIRQARIAMNQYRARLATSRECAVNARNRGQYSLWSKLMRKCKEIKRAIAVLAEYLHTLLYMARYTKVKCTHYTDGNMSELFGYLAAG